MKLTEELRNMLQYIRILEPASKKEIAVKCGVSIPKASTMINKLTDLRYLKYEDGSSSGGRIPQLVSINDNIFHSMGIDIGTEYTRIGIVNAKGKILSRYETGHNIDIPRKVELKEISKVYSFLCKEAKIVPSMIKGIGIGITGVLHEEKGICLSLRNTPDWKNFDVGKAFRDYFNIENVLITDSVKAMALTEKRYGAAKELNDFILFNIGIGLGAGIVINGNLLSGSRGTTGEIGHMHIRPSDDLCVCGNYGCLEAMASGWAVLQKCKKALRDGVESKMGEGKDINSLSVKDIIEAANSGDKIAVVAIENMAKDLSIGIGSAINLLNPEKIFLGGGFIRNAESIMMDPLIRGVKSTVIPWLQQNINIQITDQDEWNVVRGVSTMVTDKIIQSL